jgi:hypothetical protein
MPVADLDVQDIAHPTTVIDCFHELPPGGVADRHEVVIARLVRRLCPKLTVEQGYLE